MAPLRIIILAILIYIGYRLIVGGMKKKKKPNQTTQGENGGKIPVSDVLEEDPVCKKLVPRQQAIEYQHLEETYYFCSKECCKIFRTQQGEGK